MHENYLWVRDCFNPLSGRLKYSNKQDSPPTWTQEAYRQRRKTVLALSWGRDGGYLSSGPRKWRGGGGGRGSVPLSWLGEGRGRGRESNPVLAGGREGGRIPLSWPEMGVGREHLWPGEGCYSFLSPQLVDKLKILPSPSFGYGRSNFTVCITVLSENLLLGLQLTVFLLWRSHKLEVNMVWSFGLKKTLSWLYTA